MASSKSTVKSADRTTLYYGKFEYRVVLKSPHMFYSWYCKTEDDFRKRINEILEEYKQHESEPNWFNWRRPKPNVEDWEYALIGNLLSLVTKYKAKKDFTSRRENTSWCIYTSNPDIVKELLSYKPDAEVTHVNLMPAGVMTFKKEPPAAYRAYMSNSKMASGFKEDFLEYAKRTPDLRPSNAFYTYLHRSNNYYPPYLWDKYYIDYDDEKNLMMMMLMFPGMIGKKFKLEKK